MEMRRYGGQGYQPEGPGEAAEVATLGLVFAGNGIWTYAMEVDG